MPKIADCVTRLTYGGLTCRPNAEGLKTVLNCAAKTNSVENGFKWGGLPSVSADLAMIQMGAKPVKPLKKPLFISNGYLPCSSSKSKTEVFDSISFIDFSFLAPLR